MRPQTQGPFFEKPVDARKVFDALAKSDQHRMCRSVVDCPLGRNPVVDELREVLKNCRGNLVSPGFRPGKVRWATEALCHAAKRSPHVARLLLKAWVALHEPVFRETSRQVQAAKGDCSAGADADASSHEIVGRVALQFPGAREDEVRLAFELCKHGIVCRRVGPEDGTPRGPEEHQSGEATVSPEEDRSRCSSPLLAGWLRDLYLLGADAPEWDEIGTFASALRELAESKLTERSAATIEMERRALVEVYSDEIKWLGRTIPPLALLPAGAAGREKLERIGLLLADFRQVREDSGKSLALERQLRQRREQLLVALESELTDSVESELAQGTVEANPLAAIEPLEAANSDRAETEGQAGYRNPTAASVCMRDREGTAHQQEIRNDDSQASALEASPEERPPDAEAVVESVTDGQLSEGATVHATDSSFIVEENGAAPSTATREKSNTAPAWNEAFWRMIAEDDLAGAYWLARAAEADGRVPPIEAWLLAAAEGARALSSDSDPVAADLQHIASTHAPSESQVEALMAVSAALRPALLAPSTGLAAWLTGPIRLPSLQRVLVAVANFASLNSPIRQAELIGYETREAVERRIRALIVELERWGERAAARRMQFAGATDVWERLVTKEIRPLIRKIRDEGWDASEEVRTRLGEWEGNEWIQARIDNLNAEIHGPSKPRIVGKPREQIVRRLQEAASLVRQWYEIAERAADGGQPRWIEQRIGQLRRTIQGLALDVRAELVATAESADTGLAAALRACARAFDDLRAIVGLADSPEMRNSFEPSLESVLGRRLHLLPEVELDDTGLPPKDRLGSIERALLDPVTADRSVEQVIAAWIERGDHRFVDSLLDRVTDLATREELTILVGERRDRERLELRRVIDDTLVRIEQAVVDGVLEDERRNEFLTEMLNDLDSIVDFSRRKARLQLIQEEIDKRRADNITTHRERWSEYKRRLSETEHARFELEHFTARVEGALAQTDVRLVDELLAHVEEVLDGKSIPKQLLTGGNERPVLEAYLEEIPRIEHILTASGRRFTSIFRSDVPAGQHPVPEWGSVPSNRKREAEEAIRAWDAIKKARPANRDLEKNLLAILGYLGFFLEDKPVVRERVGDDWALFSVSMSASNLSPVPQFGSAHSGPFHVLCVWERPGADTLVSRLREERIGSEAVLVFYLGRLTTHQRRSMLRGIQRNEMAVATLDEILLVYLARERDSRLPAFFACTLPYTGINPYTPFRAGDVPREMFFGREELARELERPEGSCIVYGGRQLGKSALLRQVQRQVHNPDAGKFALFLDINLIGEARSGLTPEHLWHQIRDGLKDLGVLPRKATTDRKEEIKRLIREWLAADAQRRLIVLLDEADHFLNADARNAFQEVTGLRALMMETGRRFKVVFAGLHNVQRFQGLPNQPLAHFGRAICVGPLEPRAAWDLIMKPLHVLGFRFADPSAIVLRILSYTNYHPGLIQLFCQELLKRLRETHAHSTPPYVVEAGVVEAGYNRDLRERIRERFEWTLALDPRYQAVAWSMIVEQSGEPSYARSFTAQEIIRLVRSWTAAMFDNVETSELRGLLDEMVGLGVLVRGETGAYRLRSPNLVRMLGREKQILEQLAELGTKGVAAPFDADSYHRQLKSGWSPFSSAQERLLVDPKYGTALIFGSPAQGIDRVPAALEQLYESTDEFRFFDVGMISGVAGLADALGAVAKKSARTLIHVRMPREQLLQVQLVKAGNEWAQRHARARSEWARIVFVFDPCATLSWLRLPAEERQGLEDRASAVLWPRRWNRDGLWQTFERLQKVLPERSAERALEITGGWPWLVGEMLRRSANRDDPRIALDEIKQALSIRDDEFTRRFSELLGVTDPIVQRVFQTIWILGPLEPEDFGPEFVEGEPDLTREECAAAVEMLRRLELLVTERGQIRVERVAAGVLG